jgi:hypothetical protein
LYHCLVRKSKFDLIWCRIGYTTPLIHSEILLHSRISEEYIRMLFDSLKQRLGLDFHRFLFCKLNEKEIENWSCMLYGHFMIWKMIWSNKSTLHVISGTLWMVNQIKLSECKYTFHLHRWIYPTYRGEKKCFVVRSSPQTIAWHFFSH